MMIYNTLEEANAALASATSRGDIIDILKNINIDSTGTKTFFYSKIDDATQ